MLVGRQPSEQGLDLYEYISVKYKVHGRALRTLDYYLAIQG